jgi:putative nucleotidyltransferase with HDIG domain
MSRTQALEQVKKNVKNKNLVKHMLATEAVMRGLAEHFGEDPDRWGLAGLLHDIDYDKTADDPYTHSKLGAEMLQDLGYDEDIVYAVKVHNDAHGFERKSLMDRALYCTDPLTGLIVASALIHPDKKLESIDVQFVLNRFNEKGFARGARREQIASCEEELGLSLEKFIETALDSMKSIHKELGL